MAGGGWASRDRSIEVWLEHGASKLFIILCTLVGILTTMSKMSERLFINVGQ